MIGAGRRVQQNNGIFPQYDKKEPGRKGRTPFYHIVRFLCFVLSASSFLFRRLQLRENLPAFYSAFASAIIFVARWCGTSSYLKNSCVKEPFA